MILLIFEDHNEVWMDGHLLLFASRPDSGIESACILVLMPLRHAKI